MASLESHAPISLPLLLSNFQSLGDNCEFGLVQRAAGVEKTSIFRLAYVPTSEMVALLEDRLRAFEQGETLTMQLHGENLMVGLEGHALYYHKPHVEGAQGDLKANEISRIGYLRHKLMRDLERADEIFVRKMPEGGPVEAILPLLRLLRSHGPNTLLWVVPADSEHPPGSVEWADDGLLKGYMDRFAPYEEAADFSFDCWIEVCVNAYRLWKGAEPLREIGRPNLIAQTLQDQAPFQASLVPPETIAPLHDGEPVFEHRIAEGDGSLMSFWNMGEAEGGSMVASAWVMLPQDSGIAAVIPFNTDHQKSSPMIASPHRRDVWQRVWVSAEMTRGARLIPGLWAMGTLGAVFYSTGWRVEKGHQPTGYIRLPHRASPFPGQDAHMVLPVLEDAEA